MPVSMDQIKQLRDKTNAGFMDCKQALEDTKGDIDQAVQELRKKGLVVAAKRGGRAAKEGLVSAYIHHGGKVGVLLEVNCETDFVARNEKFQEFVKDVAMQIAAANPQYLAKEDVPAEAIEREKEVFKAQAGDKPAAVLEKMMVGKLNKFYQETCLLQQLFVKDDKRTIQDYLTEITGQIGENIVIRRFARYQLGEEK